MIARVIRFLRHPLVHGSAWITIATFSAGALSYLFQIAMARLLPIEVFGDLGALLAFSALASAPLGTLTFLVTRATAGHIARGSEATLHNKLLRSTQGAAVIVCIVAIVLILLARPITTFFHIESVHAYIIIVSAMLPMLIAAIGRGYLIGRQRFIVYTVSGLAEAVSKLVFAIALVLLAWGILGAVVAVAFAVIIGGLITLPWLRVVWERRERAVVPLRSMFRRALPTIIALMLLATLLQIDVLAVKRWFIPETAGQYNGIAILGRIVFFFATSIAGALVPIAVAGQARGDGSARQTLAFAVGLIAAVSTVTLVVAVITAPFVVPMMLGEQFSSVATLLPWHATAMVGLAFVYLFVYFLLAMHARLVTRMLVIVFVAEVATLIVAHESLFVLVRGITFVFMGAAVVFGMLAWKNAPNASSGVDVAGEFPAQGTV